MSKVSVHDFQVEVDCIYDDELYSVRDNGALLRHPRMGKRLRRLVGNEFYLSGIYRSDQSKLLGSFNNRSLNG